MSPSRFASVDEYYASLDDPAKAQTLRAIVDAVLADFPELAPKIAWNVPQIHRDGKYVLGVSASRDHLSVAPWSTAVMETFAPRLAGYDPTANLFRIPIDWDVDRALLGDLVRARLAELD